MPVSSSRFSAFIAELRRRRILRVAAFYSGIAFVIIQIIDGDFDYLRIPSWIGTTLIMLFVSISQSLLYCPSPRPSWLRDAPDDPALQLRVMTFNLRYASEQEEHK